METLVVQPLVGTLINTLTQLLTYNVNLIINAKGEFEGLKNDLLRFQAFLEDASSSAERNNSQSMQAMVRDIIRLVHKAEDVIDKFIVETAANEERKRWSVKKIGHPVKKRNIAKEIESIRQEMTQTIQVKNQLTLQSQHLVGKAPPAKKEEPVVEEDNVVGFDEEAKTVITNLMEGDKGLTAITITGMPGQGKTTLAKKIYNDQAIKYKFFPCIWVHVSQEYNRKDIFLDILNKFSGAKNSTAFNSVQPIIEQLHERLASMKYLVVLDDVWTGEAFDQLKTAFPNNDMGSKILITSRHGEVATHANPDEVGTHKLKFLTDKESQELLEIKVFGKGKRPPEELQVLSEQIATECRGLPLAVVIIAGIVLNNRERKSWWENVANNVKTFIVRDPKKFMEVVAWSYKQLPYHLRLCFLYLGAFRKGSEIAVQKLIRLWIAEGFIEESVGINFEDAAEACVTELINRNLLITVERKVNGQIKTCRVHDILRQFCTTEAQNQNLYLEIEGSKQQVTSLTDQCRRVSVHSGFENFLSSPQLSSLPHLRTLLCFLAKQISMTMDDILKIPKAFKLLRVLDIESISFENFPPDVVQLALLSYLALSCKITTLPSKISKLWSLQTLILKARNPALKLPEEMWNMNQLRHLYTDASAQLPPPPSEGKKGMQNMQSLSRISPDSCSKHVFTGTPEIKKLGVRGKIGELFRSFFDNVGKLEHLTNLKLENDFYLGQPSQAERLRLPAAEKFPKMLNKLTLSRTFLEWEEMAVLGALENLEVLKVKDYAFKGEYWQTKDGRFSSLKLLHIERTDLVKWEASSDHFPRLKCLLLRHCDKLEAVPTCLAEVATLEILELHRTNDKAKASAREIERRKQEGSGGGESGSGSGSKGGTRFTLSIYPPEGSQDP